MPRAFRVEKAGLLAGYLGDDPGPFVFAADSAGAYPLLHHLRYTSVAEELEDEVGQILERDPRFSAAEQALVAAGFSLSPVAHEGVFQPVRDVPAAGPGARIRSGGEE